MVGVAIEHEDLILYRLNELREDIGNLRSDVRTWHNDHEERLREIERKPRNGSGKQFWTSIVALAMSFVAFAASIWKAR